MDSQVTLVTVAPAVRLVFSQDSMKNATLFLNSTPTYIMTTDMNDRITELRAAATNELLARITRKEILHDTVVFPALHGGKAIRVANWLTKSTLPQSACTRHTIQTHHGNYILCSHPTYRLALYREDDTDTPIAHWDRHSSISLPTLLIRDEALASIRAEIIAAFVVREFRVRMKEKAAQVALGSPAGRTVYAPVTKNV
ncbi:hypothetical protein R3P38DRAFT_2905764 [Favolaschia claudopus]|uniref:DUF6593 domain-containing protein n=1 Tax=Favolaschia claudopus TaxID=2862362 RepID=A0AAW0CHJ5_9AGAR